MVTPTRAELQRSNEHLAAYAGQVSHDLRGPLAAVRGFLEVLNDSPAVRADPRAARAAALALASTGRMAGMIADLLAYARVGGALRCGPVDLGVLLGEVLDDLGADAAPVHAGPLPTVWGDAVQLRAVLHNLITNAVRHSSPDRPPRVDVRAVREGDSWRVEVRDHGTGVPPERREEAFLPLARVHEAASGGDRPGTGIGLATCRRVIAAHGGRTGLADGPGGTGGATGADGATGARGTTAWFTLPDPG